MSEEINKEELEMIIRLVSVGLAALNKINQDYTSTKELKSDADDIAAYVLGGV